MEIEEEEKRERGRGHALPRNNQEQGKRMKKEMIRKIVEVGEDGERRRNGPPRARKTCKERNMYGKRKKGGGESFPLPFGEREGKRKGVECLMMKCKRV